VRGDNHGNTSSPFKNLLPVDGRYIEKRNGFAFSGIAVNKDFRNTVCSFGCRLVDYLEFPDHHAYTDLDLQKILKLANEVEAEILLTTEKDYVRVAHRFPPRAMELVVVGIKTAFGADTDAFTNFLRSRLAGL
jgi:tetraacyldisaccharide 4'-kinase